MNDPRPAPTGVRAPAVPGRPVVDPAAWTGSDLEKREDWIYRLTEREIGDLLAMAKSVGGRIGGDSNLLLRAGRDDFDLGAFASRLAEIRHDLKDGLGLALIRGLPLDAMTPVEAATLYWGIGRHLGTAVSNNPDGDMIGHVMDLGGDYEAPTQRGYQTRATMDYHCDQCDIVGLLCIQTAKSGGLSKVASSIAVYNELLRRRPDLIGVLAEPFCWSKHAEADTGEKGFYESPVFNFLEGNLCTSFGPKHMEKGHALPEAPDMSALQAEAIRVAEDICEELHYAMELERGDIQLLNNSVALHTRTAFEDWPEPERKRRLWRLWLVAPDMRPPTPYIQQWRNGVHMEGTELRIVL